MSRDSKDEEMICGLTADERDLLQHGLRELPDVMPPRHVWQRIREQAEAEGLIRQRRMRRPITWHGGLGLAAAAALAAVLVPVVMKSPEPDGVTVPPTTQPTNTVEVNALQALMVESRQLESDLRSLPDEPRVRQAGTVATISEIEDRVAAIDYQLNDPAIHMTAEEKEIFWRERVRLMKLLVGLRYAQAQRTAF
ncbi:MAG: hypothetical protein OER22_06730 [Gammaproteobacteria bacterium]|nr:hypothetical protein [Gammaproteobacteria bacterium]MDH3374006.1 hypothetical protein [Gammaproteobacteria bacterium]MDH3409899.1 hypothetical protein [Gammaproteobacteria bacterium]MDH3552293.1 hypothetical protein [Gammaproteobacteria bacterium]